MPKLPDRWEQYSNIGNVIPGTRFITFKVPLGEYNYGDQPKSIWFTPEMLMDSVRKAGYQLGMIIDLTFTRRYYRPQQFTSKGIHYQKILVPGHEIPSSKIIAQFYDIVDAFLQNSDYNGCLVGVHCTHGVNRTGYIICRYMIEKLGMSPEAAIRVYGEARGYPVERENYIQDLKRRSLLEESGDSVDHTKEKFGVEIDFNVTSNIHNTDNPLYGSDMLQSVQDPDNFQEGKTCSGVDHSRTKTDCRDRKQSGNGGYRMCNVDNGTWNAGCRRRNGDSNNWNKDSQTMNGQIGYDYYRTANGYDRDCNWRSHNYTERSRNYMREYHKF